MKGKKESDNKTVIKKGKVSYAVERWMYIKKVDKQKKKRYNKRQAKNNRRNKKWVRKNSKNTARNSNRQ